METAIAPVGPADGWDWLALHQFAGTITRRLLHDRSDAEDAAQEAMLRAYRAIKAGRTPDDVEAWIATIARHEAFRLHGRRKSATMLDDAFMQCTEPASDPAAMALDRLGADQLLAGLDAQTRELLIRRFALEQSSVEIGAAMEIPPSTVRVRLHRCLGQLRRLREFE